LVLVGRNKAQLRQASPQSITEEQIETFFSELADTCNVVRSAKAAGFSVNWAYRKRKMDAGFRAGWARAVAEGYAKLELVLLDRAMNGTVKRHLWRHASGPAGAGRRADRRRRGSRCGRGS